MPIELAILDVCVTRSFGENPECHGFLIASLVKVTQKTKFLTAYGTLYRALGRLEKAGLLTSRWEDISSLSSESRPRRRLYRITDLGSEALAKSRSVDMQPMTNMNTVPIVKGET